MVSFDLFWGPFLKKISFSLQKEEGNKKQKGKTKENVDQFLTRKKAKLGPIFDSTAYMYVCMYVYIYAVELKTGPIFAFSSVKSWSNFLFFFVFLFLKISFSLQKEEDFSKKKRRKTNKKKHF